MLFRSIIHLDTCKEGGCGYHDYPVPVTETVHHDAVYKDQTITIVDKEEWDEYLYTECTTCGARK